MFAAQSSNIERDPDRIRLVRQCIGSAENSVQAGVVRAIGVRRNTMPLFSQLSDADSRARPGYASPGEQTHATTKAPSQCRILVVEDEGIIALDLSNTLRSLGHVVMGVAISGEQAIQLAVEMKPDLVTMDIRLQGDIDGIEAAQQIRSRLGVPIIYVTAFADENTRQRAKMTNPAGFLSKPFVKSQLYEAIETAISRPASD